MPIGCLPGSPSLDDALALDITMLDVVLIIFAIVLFSGLLIHFMQRRIYLATDLDIYQADFYQETDRHTLEQ